MTANITNNKTTQNLQEPCYIKMTFILSNFIMISSDNNSSPFAFSRPFGIKKRPRVPTPKQRIFFSKISNDNINVPSPYVFLQIFQGMQQKEKGKGITLQA